MYYEEDIKLFFETNPAAIYTSAVVGVFILVLSIVAMWKIFEKAGEKGWKAIIPFYDFYILCKIVWKGKVFWQILLISIAGAVCDSVATQLEKDSAGQIVLLVLSTVCAVLILIYEITLCIRMSTAFGHGAGYAVGLIFLSFIFMMILGFGSSKYVGNPDSKPQTAKK